MRKAEYKMIAGVFKKLINSGILVYLECSSDSYIEKATLLELAKRLSDAFEQNNKKFRRDKFMEACGL